MIGSAVGMGEDATALAVSPSRPNRDPSDSNNEKTGRERAVYRAGGCGIGTLKPCAQASVHARITRREREGVIADAIDRVDGNLDRDLRDVVPELWGAAGTIHAIARSGSGGLRRPWIWIWIASGGWIWIWIRTSPDLRAVSAQVPVQPEDGKIARRNRCKPRFFERVLKMDISRGDLRERARGTLHAAGLL